MTTSTTGIYRNQIYWCNFLPSYKFTLVGLHPCLIISSFKHLMKNDLIQVIPVTSQVTRNCKSHIALEGFGLKKDSKLMLEQIVSVNKCDLKELIGKISNIKMNEINEILRQHLQLSNQFKNLESEDMTELFLKSRGANMKNSNRELSILKTKIRLHYLEEDYKNCLLTCNKLIKLAKTNEFLWNANYYKSLCFIKTKNMLGALKFAEASLKYIDEVNVFNRNFGLSMMSMARCYEEIDIVKSIEIYKILSNIYREQSDDKMRTGIIFNIARLKKNINGMKRLINIAENTNDKRWYFYEDKEQYVDGLKLELTTVTGV